MSLFKPTDSPQSETFRYISFEQFKSIAKYAIRYSVGGECSRSTDLESLQILYNNYIHALRQTNILEDIPYATPTEHRWLKYRSHTLTRIYNKVIHIPSLDPKYIQHLSLKDLDDPEWAFLFSHIFDRWTTFEGKTHCTHYKFKGPNAHIIIDDQILEKGQTITKEKDIS